MKNSSQEYVESYLFIGHLWYLEFKLEMEHVAVFLSVFLHSSSVGWLILYTRDENEILAEDSPQALCCHNKK